MKHPAVAALLLCLAGCNQQRAQQPHNNVASDLSVANESAPAPRSPVPAPRPLTATSPDTKSAPGEGKSGLDPKSIDAARQVAQHYGALIGKGRWPDARKLWSDRKAAAAFERRLKRGGTTRVQIGSPRDEEGAAGSIYVTAPATFYTKSGQSSGIKADIILRRVNDVPGSTEAQRRWHIERIDSGPLPARAGSARRRSRSLGWPLPRSAARRSP